MSEVKAPMIYDLIGQAMREIGAIKKDRKNEQQGFMFRGIDAVYNALNPVMSKLGLFIVPEVLEQTREERSTRNGGVLIITNLKVKYTMFAPDGSFVQGVVTGEGMDSADKSNNKALSAAMKYFCFETFMVPTEDLIDADQTTPEGLAPKGTAANDNPEFTRPAATAKATVTPAKAPAKVNPVFGYIAQEKAAMAKIYGFDKDAMNAQFAENRKSLIAAGIIEDIPATQLTMEQAKQMIEAMYDNCMTDKKPEADPQ